MAPSKQYKEVRNSCEATEYVSLTDEPPEEPCPSDLQVKPDALPQTPPELSDKYKFIRELGHGAQSTAYLAENLQNGEEVVIKQLRIDFNPPDDDTAEDIIHTISTHIAPEGHLKVGDPLPILYLMDTSDAQTHGHVTHSMPFPFPLHDLNSPMDYIGTAPNALGPDDIHNGH